MGITSSNITGGEDYNPASVAVSGGTINNTTIGATTPTTGKFTTVQATTGLIGVTNGVAPATGLIGEVLEFSLAAASAVSLTSNANLAVVTASVPAGCWDVEGVVGYIPALTTSIAVLKQGATTSVGPFFLGLGTFNQISPQAVPGVLDQIISIPAVRLNFAATTSVYLIARSTFTTSTMTTYGYMRFTRVA